MKIKDMESSYVVSIMGKGFFLASVLFSIISVLFLFVGMDALSFRSFLCSVLTGIISFLLFLIFDEMKTVAARHND